VSFDRENGYDQLGPCFSAQLYRSLPLARPVVDDASAYQEIVLMVVGGIGKSRKVVVDLNYSNREMGT
jgi:hypothetical protein